MQNYLKRNRLTYFMLILVTIAAGLFSRTEFIPAIIYPYLGDLLYALLFFFIAGFIFNKKSSFQIAIISIFYCYLIELLQLYQSDWINEIRAHKLGGLILGYGFLWSDIISYTIGGLVGYIFESIYFKRRKTNTPLRD